MRRVPLEYRDGETLPGLDADLSEFRMRITMLEPLTSDSTFAHKKRALQTEFDGEPEICYLNGLVIANLRKDSFPEHTPELFQKIWAEQGEFLLDRLPLRWLVSTITTFGDHGANEAQRTIGRSLTMLFGMIKLYEFERLYSGAAPSEPHSTTQKRNVRLPLDIPAYSLKGGGLDVALLTRLWKDCSGDPIVEPLAKHLLQAVNEEPNTLFRRLRAMAEERVERLEDRNQNPIPVPERLLNHDPERITWGVAATMNHSQDAAEKFAAHHLDLGADAVVLFTDQKNRDVGWLAHHPRVEIIQNDSDLINQDQRKKLTKRHARKAYFFNCARRFLEIGWLAMLDTDEFLLPDVPMKEVLAHVPDDAAYLDIPVLEQFADRPTLFHAPAGTLDVAPDDREALYPMFGAYVPDLCLGVTAPRIMIRAGLGNIRLGNFVVKHDKKAATNGYAPDTLRLAHCHAPDWDHFLEALPRRYDEGYARRSEDGRNLRNVIEALETSADDTELRRFFDEIATPRSEVIELFAELGALFECDLALDDKVARMAEDCIQ